MKKLLLAVITFAFAGNVEAGSCVNGEWIGTWAGPGPKPTCPVVAKGPAELCFAEPYGCAPVVYQNVTTQDNGAVGAFVIAQSRIAQFPVAGIAGPCMKGWECPDLANQAFSIRHFLKCARALYVERGERFFTQ